ncbi:hypothetical protein MMC21_003674 [Puttea exsequens]|nr:hypothetical protein [Puttea exsequens]
MPAPTVQLAIANLVIYITLTPPTIYTLYRHGKFGILGWGYLVAFCMLRLIGGGLEIGDSGSRTASIISGVGLSPLLLAVLGVLHESSHHISGKRPFLLGIWFYLGLHGLIAIALGLLISGMKHSSNGSSTAGKVGTVIYLLMWIMIVGLCALSFTHPKEGREAKMLLYGVALCLPFLGVRTIYTVIGTFDRSVSAYTGPIALRAVLASLMEYIVAIDLIIFGILTRKIRQASVRSDKHGIPLQQNTSRKPVARWRR